MDGIGTPAYALGPDGVGIQGLVNTQKFDPAEARRILDAQGWRTGDGGIRVKDGRRLAFTLGSYTQRAELEPLSIVIKDQLRNVGIDVSLDRIADINTAVSTNAFDATMYSYSTIPYGDISRALESLYIPSGNNRDRYSNDRVNELHKQYIEESDPAGRRPIFEQIQRLIGEDVPIAYLLNPQQIVGTSKKVKNYVPHPIEDYKLDADLSIEA